jgi:hypothetical protein
MLSDCAVSIQSITLKDLATDYGKPFATLEEAEDWLCEVTRYCGKTNNTVVFCSEF